MNKYTWRTGVLEVVMIVIAVVFLFPVYVLVITALKGTNDQSSALQLPQHPTLTNFSQAWEQGGFGLALTNSAIVTVVSIVLTILVASTASYTLARATAKWSRGAYFVFLAGLLLPFQLALLPLYQTIRDLGLLGSIWGLVIVYVGIQMPFTIVLYTSFIRALPGDFEEAAALDGATPFRTFWSVVFPMLRPITGTVIVLNAVSVWNDFLTPLLYLSGSSQQTITVAIYGFVSQYGAQWNLIFAGILISIAPILLAYFFLQRYIVQGFAGGLKG